MNKNVVYCPYMRMAARETSDPAVQPMPQYPRTLLDYELFQLCSGGGRSTIDGQEHALEPGFLYLVQPGVPHYHEFYSRTVFYYVHFDLFYNERRESSYVVPWSMQRGKADPHLLQPAIDLPYMAAAPTDSVRQFENLLDVYREAGPLWRLRSQGMLVTLLDAFLSGDAPGVAATTLEHRLQRAVLYMRSNIHRHLSLAEMATAAHLSEYYFLRQFKKQFQQTPAQFHMQLRMEEAAVRLETSQASIQQIAHELGFKTPFHFSRCFKAHYAVSPRAFREG